MICERCGRHYQYNVQEQCYVCLNCNRKWYPDWSEDEIQDLA